MELILVVFGLFAIATPFATVFLLWRQHKLRQQLLKLTELSMGVTDNLRRDLLELRRQVEVTATTTSSPGGAAESRRTVVQPYTEKPAAPAVPVVQKPVEPVTVPPISSPPIIIPAVVVPPSVPAVDVKPAMIAQKSDEKVPAPIAPPTESKLPIPVAPKSTIPAPGTPATPPPLSRWEMPPATPPAAPVAPPAARVVAPSQLAALRSSAPSAAAPPRPSAPRPTAQQRMKSVFALEEILGTNWLNKLGIVLVVFGVALFGVYELGQLGPAGKVGLSYAASITLLGGGIVLERRDRYRILGRTLIGGGWALLFFTCYAINHVQAMRVMTSESADLILMLAVALAMVVHTLRYRSQLVTGLAFLLAYGTVALSNDNVYSLASGVILALGLVAIVIKMGWFELEVFGIFSSYANHVYWLYRLLGSGGAQGHSFPDYYASTAILLFYWITYRLSYVVRKPKSPFEEHVSTVAALLNTLLLLGSMKFQSVHPELAFMALLIIGAAEFSFGQLPTVKRRREAFVVLSVVGAALMVAAVPFRYSGNNVAILWLVGAEAFLAAGVFVGEVVFRRLGLFTGLLVGVHLIAIDSGAHGGTPRR